MAKRRSISPEEAKRRADAKGLWLDPTNKLTQLEIAERFGMSLGWLQGLARRELWVAWPERRADEPFGVPKAIDIRMYGELAADVAVLRDFGGLHVAKFHGGFRVGLDVLNADQVRARAAALRARRSTPAAGTAAQHEGVT